jgi:hypothetical protein
MLPEYIPSLRSSFHRPWVTTKHENGSLWSLGWERVRAWKLTTATARPPGVVLGLAHGPVKSDARVKQQHNRPLDRKLA